MCDKISEYGEVSALSIKGIIFLIIMVLGVLVNIFSRKIAERKGGDENFLLKIKLIALLLVIVGISLLMIFGK